MMPTKLPPVDEALFGLVAQKKAPHVSQTTEPHAYASEALGCERKIAFRVMEWPKSNPVDGPAQVTFWIGDAIHDLVQEALLAAYPEAKAEVSWSLGPVTGRADMTYRSVRDGKLVVCEIKSVAPYSFDLATGLKKGDAGVRAEHAMQADISALALEADYKHIVYVNKSASGGQNPIWESRGLADHEAARAEVARLTSIVRKAEAGDLPVRKWGGAVIDDPAKVKFPCGYCEWRDACAGIPNPEPDDASEAPF